MHSSEISEKNTLNTGRCRWQIVECPSCGVIHKRKYCNNDKSIYHWYFHGVYRFTILWAGLASYFLLAAASVYGLSVGLYHYASGKSHFPLKRLFQLFCATDGTVDELRCFSVSIVCAAILWTMVQVACVHLFRNCGDRVRINDLFNKGSPTIKRPFTLLIPQDQSLIQMRIIHIAHTVGLIAGAFIGLYIAAPYFASLKAFLEQPSISLMEMLVLLFFFWGWALISLPCAAIAEVVAVGIWRLVCKTNK